MAQGAQFSKEFGEKLEQEGYKTYRTLGDDHLDQRFGPRKLPPEIPNDIDKLAEKFWNLAWYIDTYIPNGPAGARARAIALTELENSFNWALKALTQELIAKEINEQRIEEEKVDQPEDENSG